MRECVPGAERKGSEEGEILFDTISGVCGFFISVKFATFLLALLAGG